MAKELPYFKFEPNQWENGNIQICSKESKGLFIDLCAVYWSRLGEMPYTLALQKHCNGNKDALQELENNEIISVSNGQIIIDFLDEQLNEFKETSKKRQKAANKRWSNASVMQVHSKSNAIREDKKKGDKIIKDNVYRAFAHLSVTEQENKKLLKDYNQEQIDSVYDAIENFKKNKNYTSLYLTAKNWLKKEPTKSQKNNAKLFST